MKKDISHTVLEEPTYRGRILHYFKNFIKDQNSIDSLLKYRNHYDNSYIDMLDERCLLNLFSDLSTYVHDINTIKSIELPPFIAAFPNNIYKEENNFYNSLSLVFYFLDKIGNESSNYNFEVSLGCQGFEFSILDTTFRIVAMHSGGDEISETAFTCLVFNII